MTSSFNPRAVAALFKEELGDLFNAWDAAKPLRTGAPHASAILVSESEWCLRKQVLLAIYPELAERPEVMPWTARQNAVFLNGWLLHEKYQRLFSDHGKVIEVEHSHYDETRMLHFTPDAIIEFGREIYVVEIKGYKAETWEKMDEAGEPPQAAHHQANLYTYLLGIERWLILVENKNTQEIKVWSGEQDAELAKVYIERMYAVKGRVTLARGQAQTKLPDRICPNCNDYRAQKCPVRRVCFSK